MPKKKEKEESKESSLEQVFQDLTNYFIEEGEDATPERWYLDTGNYAFNYIISGSLSGGYPSGLTSELFGDPSTGKTLLMIYAVAAMQKLGGIVIVNDIERRWDWGFAKTHGVDVDKVLKDSPGTIEDWSIRTDKVLTEILKQDPIPKLLICVDSVASLSTYGEVEGFEKAKLTEDQGKRAKRIKSAMRVLPKKISKAGSILLMANHLIADPRITYGSNQVTPGGKGITFQSSVRVEMRKPVLITPEGKDRPIGSTLRVTCTKNSETAPFGQSEMNVFWTRGIDRYSGLLDMMIDLGIVKNAGGWFEYKEQKFRAKDLQAFTGEHPEILEDPKWIKPYFLED